MSDDLNVPASGANATGLPELLCLALDGSDYRRMALMLALCLSDADAEREADIARLRGLDCPPRVFGA